MLHDHWVTLGVVGLALEPKICPVGRADWAFAYLSRGLKNKEYRLWVWVSIQ